MNSPRRWLDQAYQISVRNGPRCPGLSRNIRGSSQSTKSFQTVGRKVASVATATNAPRSHGTRAEPRGAAGRPARTLEAPSGVDRLSAQPRRRVATPVRTEATGRGLLQGLPDAGSGLHRVPRRRRWPRVPGQLRGPAKVDLTIRAPAKRHESTAQVLVGARVLGIEPDRALELIEGLRRLPALVEDGAEVRPSLRPARRDLDRAEQDLDRFAVAPLGRNDASERLEH